MPDADRDAPWPHPDIELHLVALHAVAEAAISAALAVAVAARTVAPLDDDNADEAFEYRAAERNLKAALTAFRSGLMDIRARGDRTLKRDLVNAGCEDLNTLADGRAAMDQWQREHGPFTVAEVTHARRVVDDLRRRPSAGEPDTPTSL